MRKSLNDVFIVTFYSRLYRNVERNVEKNVKEKYPELSNIAIEILKLIKQNNYIKQNGTADDGKIYKILRTFVYLCADV